MPLLDDEKLYWVVLVEISSTEDKIRNFSGTVKEEYPQKKSKIQKNHPMAA